MARYVIPITIELHFEASSVHEAFQKFNEWRKFTRNVLKSYLSETNLVRFSIPPVRELTEVDAAWLENHKLRSKFRQDWNYDVRKEPIAPGSKLMLAYRIAVGPKSESGS